ncbi:MAG: LPXTG cell wall anchor domain-containing protein [Coprococcus sp.]
MDRVLTLMDAFSEKHRDILVRPADYSKVDAALAKVPADLSIYTEETVKAVNDATAAVVRNLKETEQATVDGYAAAIENAVAKLELRKADYTKVDEAIQKAEKLNAKDYKNFDAVTKAVNAVVRDLDITKQAQVDAYAKAIEDAIAQLEKKTVTENISKPTAPQTGDAASPFTWMTLCVIAGGCVVTMKKRRA